MISWAERFARMQADMDALAGLRTPSPIPHNRYTNRFGVRNLEKDHEKQLHTHQEKQT